MYGCVEVDQQTGQCLHWALIESAWPVLTYAEASLILGLVASAFATAAVFRFLRSFIFPQH